MRPLWPFWKKQQERAGIRTPAVFLFCFQICRLQVRPIVRPVIGGVPHGGRGGGLLEPGLIESGVGDGHIGVQPQGEGHLDQRINASSTPRDRRKFSRYQPKKEKSSLKYSHFHPCIMATLSRTGAMAPASDRSMSRKGAMAYR